jgi:hypothetical protein
MLKEEHYCKNCGHRCHCYGPDCEKCYCDTCQCGRINNHNEEDIPDSFIKSNT